MRACLEGNEAVARIAHALSEVISIYPITPASGMGEFADAWSAAGRPNLWGTVPDVVEMQSEAGAAGVLHGAAQKGSLTTTFTASQGLLLMIPEMYKLAGELVPTVLHVAARAIATHALSIFGDHSDVMATRGTGFALLASSSVQEAHDLALIAHAAALRGRVPFLHFFDGFRTSHEVATLELLEDDDLRALVSEDDILAHRARGLSPDHPVLRGSSQNPDVFFQAREAVNPFYTRLPEVVQELLHSLGARTGRRMGLVDYVGHARAERVIVVMGSASHTFAQAVERLSAAGERVGMLRVRLYRPFPREAFLAALPASTREVVVLDRTKEPGSPGEPLFLDVAGVLAEAERPVRLSGGRYGLASKELTPAMAEAVLRAGPAAPRHFTVGILDDVSRTSLPVPARAPSEEGFAALFYGVGSDGSVSGCKGSAKILEKHADKHVQAYFVYDSKKSGQMTVSHLRVRDEPFEAPWLVERANYVGCHAFGLASRVDVLAHLAPGGTLLLDAPHPADEVWDRLPRELQESILERSCSVWTIDAERIAREVGLGDRVSTVTQACFLFLCGFLSKDEAARRAKAHAREAYGKADPTRDQRNDAAVERALSELAPVPVPSAATSDLRRYQPDLSRAPDFVRRVTARLLAGEGDLLPVSAFPPDGTFPTGTARWEKRALASELPIWEPGLCIDCGKCTIVCPHAAIRMKTIAPLATATAPPAFRTKGWRSKEVQGLSLTIQVSPDDCTGCTLCVLACPAEKEGRRALRMEPYGEHASAERAAFDYFQLLPAADAQQSLTTVKGSQLREPLFEYSGACSGCGETPYLKLLTQLFGDRMLVANATGCSSIFGGNLPTTPWTTGPDGRGPAWMNSLFEDNAEFGLGMRLGADRREDEAKRLLRELAGGDRGLGQALADAILGADQSTDAGVAAQRERVAESVVLLRGRGDEPLVRRFLSVAEDLVRRSVWIVGGDGWAYDIGFGGLDHVLASGRNVNVLVLDTEVYSNTGGQASKATPRGAQAKFAAAGKATPKKDLGRIAMTYEGVYVAQVALGANDRQTLQALLEADAWEGPSLVLAYSTCIAHGIEACASLDHQHGAVGSGYWALYRRDPRTGNVKIDEREHAQPLRSFEESESRFGLTRRDPKDRTLHLLTLAEHDLEERWRALGALQRQEPKR